MADLETLKQRLVQADEALHALMLGEKEVQVTHGTGRSVTFTATSYTRLQQYIAQLKADIARLEGRRGRKPMYPRF